MSENNESSLSEIPAWPLALVICGLMVGQILGAMNLYNENKLLIEAKKSLEPRAEQARNITAILRSVSQEILDISATNPNAAKIRTAFNIRMQDAEQGQRLLPRDSVEIF
jgi:hypothetical protein